MGKWDDEEAWSDEEVKPVAKAKAKPAAAKAKPAAAKAKPAAAKPAAGMDDDDWSDEESGGGYPAKKEAAAPKAKAKATAATPAAKPAEAAPKAKAAAPAPAAPGKKKNKFADKEVVGGGDLFDGFAVEKKEETAAALTQAASSASAVKSEAKVVNKDSMEALTLNLQQDVDKLVKMVTPKVTKAEAKKASNKFFTDAFRALEGKLSLQEMEQLQKQFKEIHNKRLKQKEAEEKAKRLAVEEKEKEAKRKKDEEFRAQGLMTDEDYFKDMM